MLRPEGYEIMYMFIINYSEQKRDVKTLKKAIKSNILQLIHLVVVNLEPLFSLS